MSKNYFLIESTPYFFKIICAMHTKCYTNPEIIIKYVSSKMQVK